MDSVSCRCCLKLKNEMRNLFNADMNQTYSGNTLYEKLTICIPELSILETDSYSNQICLQCIDRLKETYNFRMLCINSDHQLRLGATVEIENIKIETKVELDEYDPQLHTHIASLQTDIELNGEKHIAELDYDHLSCISEINKNKKARKKLDMLVKNKSEANVKLKKLRMNDINIPTETKTDERNPVECDAKPTNLKVRKNAAQYNEFGKKIRIRKKNVKCDICGFQTTTKFHVEEHMRVHTGDRPFTCEVCGLSFKTKACVKKHALRHRVNPIKKFACNQCRFTTDYRSDYHRHLRIHAGDLPYPCTKCDRRLPCKTSLGLHYKTFHEDKPHPCTMCEARFRTSGGLLQHIACHYRGSTHVCHVCKKLLSSRRSLRSHMKALHPGVKYSSMRQPSAGPHVTLPKCLSNK